MRLRLNCPRFVSKLQTFNQISSFVSINSFVKNTIKLVLIKYTYVYIKTYKKYKINHIKKLLQCNCPDCFILMGQLFIFFVVFFFFFVHRNLNVTVVPELSIVPLHRIHLPVQSIKKKTKDDKKNPRHTTGQNVLLKSNSICEFSKIISIK